MRNLNPQLLKNGEAVTLDSVTILDFGDFRDCLLAEVRKQGSVHLQLR